MDHDQQKYKWFVEIGVVPIPNNDNRNKYSSITDTTDINDKCEQIYIYIDIYEADYNHHLIRKY